MQKKLLKILMLNYEFPPLGGGAGNQTLYTFKELSANKNIEIDLVTSSISGFKIEAFSERIRIHYLDISKKGSFHSQSNKELLVYSYKAYFYSKKLIKNKQFDFIHAVIGIPCAYIAMKLGLPYMVSLVGSDVPFHTPKYKYLDRFIFKYLSKKIWQKANYVVANSEGLKQEALVSAPNQKFEVIFNGIDTSEFKPAKEKTKSENLLKIISVSRLAPHKGYQYLLKALEGLKNYRLTLIGDGIYIQELKKMADDLKINVIFKGRLEKKEIISELQQSDLFTLPSLNEGMSNALMEGIACGLPALVTDVGGSAELVIDNGFIVEKANSSALREKIKLYISEKGIIEKQSAASVEIAKSMSWEKVADDYLNLYLNMT